MLVKYDGHIFPQYSILQGWLSCCSPGSRPPFAALGALCGIARVTVICCDSMARRKGCGASSGLPPTYLAPGHGKATKDVWCSLGQHPGLGPVSDTPTHQALYTCFLTKSVAITI